MNTSVRGIFLNHYSPYINSIHSLYDLTRGRNVPNIDSVIAYYILLLLYIYIYKYIEWKNKRIIVRLNFAVMPLVFWFYTPHYPKYSLECRLVALFQFYFSLRSLQEKSERYITELQIYEPPCTYNLNTSQIKTFWI